MSVVKKSIFVTFQQEGIHCYPAAKDISGVEFLQYPHRHVFHFKVEIEVFHDEREIEFILFKREMQSLYDQKILNLQSKSCETIAQDLLDHLQKNNKYCCRDIIITVSEDNENGSTVSYKQ